VSVDCLLSSIPSAEKETFKPEECEDPEECEVNLLSSFADFPGKRPRSVDPDSDSEPDQGTLLQIPDLASYFNSFGIDIRGQMDICSKYSSYLRCQMKAALNTRKNK